MRADGLDAADESYALAERGREAAKSGPWMLVSASLGALLVVALLWGHVSSGQLIGWWFLVFAINSHGVWQAINISHVATSDAAWVRAIHGYEFGATFAGAAWGIGIAYFFASVTQPIQVALVAVLFLVAGGALSGMGPSFRGTAGFVGFLTVPTILASLLFDGIFYRVLAAGLLLVLVVFLRVAHLSELKSMTNMRLLARNKRLAASLALANHRLMLADAAKTRFLAAASHDLRQPMHAIGLLIGALRQQVTTAEAQDNIRRIVSAADGLTRLFDTILDISRLDAGVVAPRLESFPISRVLDSLRDQFEPYATEKRLKLKVVGSPIVVRSDPALLGRILHNFVANAMRYTENGRILVAVRRRSGAAEIQVYDTGIGIPADRIDEVFKEFVQLSNPSHDRAKGLGLGLSIVQRLATLLGHPLTVKSKVGSGSRFSVTVPTVRGETSEVQQLDASVESAASLRGAFVVIVDDEEDVLYGMNALLRSYGCHTVCATSTRDLTEKLLDHERQPDLIISDFRIGPAETGLDVIRRTRKSQELCIPAILVTGSQFSEELKLAAEDGVLVMGKPLSESELIRAVAKTLNRSAISP